MFLHFSSIWSPNLIMKSLISFRPVSDLRSQVALFVIDEDDGSGGQKPLRISHSQGCVLKFLCRMRYVVLLQGECIFLIPTSIGLTFTPWTLTTAS